MAVARARPATLSIPRAAARPQQRSENAALIISSLLVLAIAFVVCIVVTFVTAAPSFAAILMSFSLSICLAMLYFIALDVKTYPIMMSALLYLILFFELPGFIHILTNHFPFFDFSYRLEDIDRAALLVAVFCATFLGGFNIRRFALRSRHAVPRARVSYPQKSLWLIAGLFLSVSSVVAALATGYDPSLSRSEQDLFLYQLTPVKLIGQSFSQAGSFIAFMIAVLYQKNFKRDAAGRLFLLVTLIVFFNNNNVIALPRYVVGSYILTLIFATIDMSPLRRGALFISMLVAQITVFPLLSDIARGGGASAFEFSPFRYLSTHGDFDGFQSVINAVVWTQGAGLRMGVQLLSATLFFVPRPFAPWKSVGTGADAASYVGYPYLNISAPLPAELYVDFGLIGLVFMTAGLGWYIHRLDDGFGEQKRRGGLAGLLTAVTAGYAFILLRGALVGILGPFVVSIALVWLTERIVGRRHHRFAAGAWNRNRRSRPRASNPAARPRAA